MHVHRKRPPALRRRRASSMAADLFRSILRFAPQAGDFAGGGVSRNCRDRDDRLRDNQRQVCSRHSATRFAERLLLRRLRSHCRVGFRPARRQCPAGAPGDRNVPCRCIGRPRWIDRRGADADGSSWHRIRSPDAREQCLRTRAGPDRHGMGRRPARSAWGTRAVAVRKHGRSPRLHHRNAELARRTQSSQSSLTDLPIRQAIWDVSSYSPSNSALSG